MWPATVHMTGKLACGIKCTWRAIKIGKVHISQAMWPAITAQGMQCGADNLTCHDEHEKFSSPVMWIMARPTSCHVHCKRCAVWLVYGPQWQPVTAQAPGTGQYWGLLHQEGFWESAAACTAWKGPTRDILWLGGVGWGWRDIPLGGGGGGRGLREIPLGVGVEGYTTWGGRVAGGEGYSTRVGGGGCSFPPGGGG